MSMLIRLKPRDMKKGHVIQRYTVASHLILESRGWYLVPDELATYLATVHQVPNDEDSPLAFDVCTQDEAQAIDDAERRKAEERARAAEPNVTNPRELVVSGELPNQARRPRSVATARRP